MERFGISVDVKNIPVLDPEYTPLLKFNRAFLKGAAKPVSIRKRERFDTGSPISPHPDGIDSTEKKIPACSRPGLGGGFRR